MIIGSTIRPELLVNDYSGFTNAGAIRGQATAQMGKDIAGAATTGMSMYKETKALQGQTDAFGKSMDMMAKAFPQQAGMFDEAKNHVMDPNASLIDRVARMNEFQKTLSLINQQKMVDAQMQNLSARTAAVGGSGGGGAAATSGPTDQRASDFN
jgi:hypothetical protein